MVNNPLDSKDIRIGIIVTAIAGIFLLIWVGVSFASLIMPSQNIFVGFGAAGGVGVNSPVHYDGVYIGDVIKAKLFSESEGQPYRVRFTCRVPGNLFIPKDSAVTVKSIGLMGEKALDIKSGNLKNGFLEKGDVILGQPSLDVSDIFDKAQALSKDFELILEGFSELRNDEDFKASLKNAFSNLRGLVGDFEQIKKDQGPDLAKLQDNMKELQSGIGDDFKGISQKFSDIRSKLEAVKSENKTDLEEIKKSMDLAAKHFDGYNKIIEEKGILYHLKVPKDVKEAMKSESAKKREQLDKRLGR